jgi:hypothetical protein
VFTSYACSCARPCRTWSKFPAVLRLLRLGRPPASSARGRASTRLLCTFSAYLRRQYRHARLPRVRPHRRPPGPV